MMILRQEKRKKILYAVFLVILVLYPLRNVWLGVEVTDGTYSAGNYRFLENVNPMWLFSTWLANLTGRLLSELPGGHTLMGLRCYIALFISAIAVVMFLFFTKVIRVESAWTFLGELLAISLCWCPTTILYNYMTYFFFNMGIVVLYLGLVKEKRLLLFGAGVLLGMNVLVRFPNLAEAALICSLWYYGYLQRKRIKDVVQETGICLLGYLAGIGVILLTVMASYGLEQYVAGIIRLMQMPSEASEYTPLAMVLAVLMDYKFSAKWLVHMLLLVGAGSLISAVVYAVGGRRSRKAGCAGSEKTTAEQEKSFADRWAGLIGKLFFLGCIAALFRRWHAIGVFNVKYYTYESMFQWMVVFLLLTIFTVCHVLFSRKFTRNEKLLASMVLVVIAVTPLGSNNHLYPNLNNMFLVFPFALAFFTRFLKAVKESSGMSVGKRGWKFSLFPAGAMLLMFLAATVLQCLLFGAVFTFRDGMQGERRDTRIEKNTILKGMVTNAPMAESVESLTAFVEEEGLSDRSVILYGMIPGISYILDMPPAISTSWPDLESYHYEVLAQDMQNLRESPPENGRPLIILGRNPERWVRGEQFTEKELKQCFLNEKWELIYYYMVEQGYEKVYEDGVFYVYR